MKKEESTIGECFSLVESFFNDDEKTLTWFFSENPLLDDVSPIEMILSGRKEKLLQFIKTQLKENKPV